MIDTSSFAASFDAIHTALMWEFDDYGDMKFSARVLVAEDCYHALRQGDTVAQYVCNIGPRNVVSYARTLVAGLSRDVLAPMYGSD